MQGAGSRYLIAIAVAAAVMTGASARAETYRPATREVAAHAARTEAKPTARRTMPTPVTTQASQRSGLSNREIYSRAIAEASAQYAVPERLIWAVIRVESGFDHRAVSRKGARGLMQLMPKTAAMLGVRNAFDPRQNIHGGTRHLRALMERFPYDLHLAVAAYNAGEGAVLAFGGVPPYPETRDYVVRVLRLYATPIDCCQWQGSDLQRIGDIQRFIDLDGTITYTNVPVTRVSALLPTR